MASAKRHTDTYTSTRAVSRATSLAVTRALLWGVAGGWDGVLEDVVARLENVPAPCGTEVDNRETGSRILHNTSWTPNALGRVFAEDTSANP